MKNAIVVGTLLVLLLSIGGMGCVAFSPVPGVAYTDVRGPLIATNATESTLEGRSEAVSYLGLVATGDASITAAMEDGGITVVHHVDFETWSVLGVYTRFTTVVYGQ